MCIRIVVTKEKILILINKTQNTFALLKMTILLPKQSFSET